MENVTLQLRYLSSSGDSCTGEQVGWLHVILEEGNESGTGRHRRAYPAPDGAVSSERKYRNTNEIIWLQL